MFRYTHLSAGPEESDDDAVERQEGELDAFDQFVENAYQKECNKERESVRSK